MSLYAVRVKYLHDTTEVDTLHEIVDVRMPNVVAKDQKGLLDPFRLSQRHDQVSEVGEPCVHLNHNYGSVVSQRTERLFVVHSLLGVRPFYVSTDLRYFELG